MAKQETFDFRAETDQLLSQIIESLYSDTDKFLRDLINNSSASLDKIYFESLTNKRVLHYHPDLFIRIVCDKTNNTLSIMDSGIGMTKADLENTIAVSRTKDIIMEGQEDHLAIIGKWFPGIGESDVTLYDSLAEKVVFSTKHNDDDQYVLDPQSDGSFIVTFDTYGLALYRGTNITLFLKEYGLKYLEESRMKILVKEYSKSIRYPVYLVFKDEIVKKRKEDMKHEFEGLCKVMKDVLGNCVDEVVVTDLDIEECCFMPSTRTTEINPEEPMMLELKKLVDDGKVSKYKRRINYLYEMCFFYFWLPTFFEQVPYTWKKEELMNKSEELIGH